MREDAAEIFKILGVKTRLMIIDILKTRSPIGAKEIAEEVGITTAAASQHLKILKQAGFVTNRRDGYWIPYSLNKKALEDCSEVINQVCCCTCNDNSHSHHHGGHKNFDQMSLEELIEFKTKLENKLSMITKLIHSMKE